MGRFKIPVGVKIFAAIWLLALCVPTTRELPRTFGFVEMFRGQSPMVASATHELARENPDNATAAAWGAENDWRGYGGDAETDEPIGNGDKRALKRVGARFPRDLQILSLQLRTSCESLTNPKIARAKNDVKSRAQWLEAAQIARAGAQLDPDNAYWPWMEAAFAFVANRDDAALQAFERAGNCARYDDYIHATLNARLKFWESVSSPSWDQKVALWAGTLYSHLGPMREAASLATERAMTLRKSGDNARAFALESDVLQVARLLHQQTDALFVGLVAEDIANKSLEEFTGIAATKGSVTALEMQVHSVQLADNWASLARQNGRNQLAARADWLRAPSVRTLYSHSIGNDDWMMELIGMRAPWGIFAVIAPLVLLALGLTIAAGALLWSAGIWIPFRGIAPTRGQAVMCSNFSFWLLIGVVAVAVAVGWRSHGILFDFGAGSFAILAFGLVGAAAVCWLLPIWFLHLKARRKATFYRPAASRPLLRSWNNARKISWISFGFALLLTISNGRGLWDGTWFQLSNSALLADITLALALVTEFARWLKAGWRLGFIARPNAPKSAATGRARWVPLGLWLLCGALLSVPATNFFAGVPLAESLFPLALAGLAALGALWASWRLSSDHFWWQLARRSAGILVVAASALFLLLAIASWPLQIELNRNLDRRIQIGEIRWMREQIAKPQ